MTDQQELFATEYVRLGCKNATQAAVNAGYSEKTACEQASRLLRNVKVREIIEDFKSQSAEELRNQMAFEALTAFNVMIGIMNDKDAKDADRLKAATEVMDRSGFGARKEISVDTNMVFAFEVDDGDSQV